MRMFFFFFTIVVALHTSTSAYATDTIQAVVALPGGEVSEAASRSIVASSMSSRASKLGVSLSSWTPSDFRLESRLSATTPFESRGLPDISASYFFPVGSFGRWVGGSVAAEIGARFKVMTRKGSFGVSAIEHQETLYLGSLRAGLEYYPAILKTRRWSPHMGLALVPTVFAAGRSVFDDGILNLGLPIEASVGTEFGIFNFGVLATVGKMGEANLSGLGVSGGVRLAL